MRTDAVVREYVKRLSDKDLSFLGIRFKQGLCGDNAEIAQKLSEDAEIDEWLTASTSADEWFDMVDLIGENIRLEYGRRLGEEEDRKKKRFRRD